MTYPWPTLMPMGVVVISCVRLSVQPSMGLGLCTAYKALGRNGLQFGMLMYPDGLHSAFMDACGYCCWSVCPSICPFVRLRLSNHLGFFFFLLFFSIFFSKVRVGAKEGGSHYWEMAVAITCGYGGYLLPLLAAHSSFCNDFLMGWGVLSPLVKYWESSNRYNCQFSSLISIFWYFPGTCHPSESREPRRGSCLPTT